MPSCFKTYSSTSQTPFEPCANLSSCQLTLTRRVFGDILLWGLQNGSCTLPSIVAGNHEQIQAQPHLSSDVCFVRLQVAVFLQHTTPSYTIQDNSLLPINTRVHGIRLSLVAGLSGCSQMNMWSNLDGLLPNCPVFGPNSSPRVIFCVYKRSTSCYIS